MQCVGRERVWYIKVLVSARDGPESRKYLVVVLLRRMMMFTHLDARLYSFIGRRIVIWCSCYYYLSLVGICCTHKSHCVHLLKCAQL